MRSLDSHCVSILKLLCESKAPVPIAALSLMLDTTPRMVHYRLKMVDSWLGSRNANLVSRSRMGVFIDATDDEKDTIRKELGSQAFPPYHSSHERAHHILLGLLTQSEIMTIKLFQYQLKVSRSTILNDCHQVEAWLCQHDIHLVKRQNYGCLLQGSEVNIRQAILSLLIEVVGEVNLLFFLGNLNRTQHEALPEDNSLLGVFHSYINSLNLSFFNHLAEQMQDITHKMFSDHSRMNFTMKTGILVKRLSIGKVVEIAPADIQVLRSRPDFHLSATLVEKINRELGLPFPNSEIAYLMILITEAESQTITTGAETVHALSAENVGNIESIVEHLLGEAKLYLHPALHLDFDLKNSLQVHFASLLEHPRPMVGDKNPLLEDVKQVYPEIYQMVKNSMPGITNRAGEIVTEDEYGYITMHLAAAMERLRLTSRSRKKVIIVCNAGVATSKLLASRVLGEFPEIEIAGVMSYFEYQNLKGTHEHDLVITTIPLSTRDRSSVVVGPLLNSVDVERIRIAIRGLERGESSQRECGDLQSSEIGLHHLLNPHTIDLQVKVRDWEEVIEHAGNLLVKIAAIEKRYISAMKRIRGEFGPYMVIMPGIALLHAFPEDGVNKLCMSMVTLNPLINFGSELHDPVFLAFVLGAVDNRSHLRPLSELVGMLKDNAALHTFRTTYHKTKVLNLISRYSGGYPV